MRGCTDRGRVYHPATGGGGRAGPGHRVSLLLQRRRQLTISAKLRLNYDSNRALARSITLVNSVKNQLPPQSQQPVVSVGRDDSSNLMYLGFYSSEVPSMR